MTVALLTLVLLISPGVQTASGERGSPLRERVATVEHEVASGYGSALKLQLGPLGSAQVSAWRESKVRIEARVELHAPTEADLDRLASVIGVTIIPDSVTIAVNTTGPHDKEFMKTVKNFPKELGSLPYRVDYVIWVPEYTSLDIRVNEGETIVDGINGVSSIRSLRGPMRLVNLSGTVVAVAGEGDVEARVLGRSWRGGSLDLTVGRGNIRLSVPQGFSARLDASAPAGVFVEDGESKNLGPLHTGNLGPGGATVHLTTSDGTITIAMEAKP